MFLHQDCLNTLPLHFQHNNRRVLPEMKENFKLQKAPSKRNIYADK